MLKQKNVAFWYNSAYFQFEKAINKRIINFRNILIPCIIIAVLLGVLFLLPKIACLASGSQIDADSLIKLTNEQREKNGLSLLVYNETLALAAQNKAKYLLANNYFSHNGQNGKDFSDWVREVGYDYAYTGENLAMDFITNERVMNGWMNSGKHRENILNSDYKEIGIAAVSGWFDGRKTVMVAQVFGTQLTKKADYLAVNSTFLLPRFLSFNTFDIFVPKTENKTIVRHNGVETMTVLNSGHVKKYSDWNEKYWGEVDGSEFNFKKVKITLLGQNNRTLDMYPTRP